MISNLEVGKYRTRNVLVYHPKMTYYIYSLLWVNLWVFFWLVGSKIQMASVKFGICTRLSFYTPLEYSFCVSILKTIDEAKGNKFTRDNRK